MEEVDSKIVFLLPTFIYSERFSSSSLLLMTHESRVAQPAITIRKEGDGSTLKSSSWEIDPDAMGGEYQIHYIREFDTM